MPEVILETGAEQDYETLAEAYGIIPVDADDLHAIRCMVAGSYTGLPTWVIANANGVKHRLEAALAVRHDGKTPQSGAYLSGGNISVIESNDVIIQDLGFRMTTNNRIAIDGFNAAATNLVIRRCMVYTTTGAVGMNPGIYLRDGGNQAVWFTIVAQFGTGGTISLWIGEGASGYFSASYTKAGINVTHQCLNQGGGNIIGYVSLDGDGGTTTEYSGEKDGTKSRNVGEGEAAPGADALDLTDHLETNFAGVFNSSDGSDLGIKDSFLAIPAAAYDGIDVTGFNGFEAIDIEGKVFDPDNMVVGPRQPELVTGGGSRPMRGYVHMGLGMGRR